MGKNKHIGSNFKDSVKQWEKDSPEFKKEMEKLRAKRKKKHRHKWDHWEAITATDVLSGTWKEMHIDACKCGAIKIGRKIYKLEKKD